MTIKTTEPHLFTMLFAHETGHLRRRAHEHVLSIAGQTPLAHNVPAMAWA